MAQSASQAHAFYRDVANHRRVWTVKDDDGFPAPLSSSGKRAQPFWSSLSRVQRIIKTVPAYVSFAPIEISWDDFRDKWLPGLEQDGLLIGVNWSGKNATGYDLDPGWLRKCVENLIEQADTDSTIDKDQTK